MSLVTKCRILTLSIVLSVAAAWGVDKDKSKFSPGPAESYQGKQSNAGVTIAVAPFETDEQAQPAFGKDNPYKHGVLPVLVIIKNDSKGALKLEQMRIEYVD